MKITREINGQMVEIELTSEEVRDIYEEKEHEYDVQNVKAVLENASPEEFYDKYQISLNWAYNNEELIENIADDMRKNIDKYDMHWDSARDNAMKDIIAKHVRDFQYDDQDKFEKLKYEYAKKRGWLGEDEEFASTWWENDENLHDAEEYAYGVLEKEHLAPLVETDSEKASLESMISDAEKQKASAEQSMIEMDYREMCDLFRAVEKTGAGHVSGHIVFTESSFTAPYGVESRTYVVSSDNKAFQPNMGGYSIYGSSLDGSDVMVRLENYMAAEKGGKGGWQIEKCYMRGDEIHKAHGIVNRPREERPSERD